MKVELRTYLSFMALSVCLVHGATWRSIYWAGRWLGGREQLRVSVSVGTAWAASSPRGPGLRAEVSRSAAPPRLLGYIYISGRVQCGRCGDYLESSRLHTRRCHVTTIVASAASCANGKVPRCDMATWGFWGVCGWGNSEWRQCDFCAGKFDILVLGG